MRAYKFLGDDLVSTTPYTANALIDACISSVVRNHIANNTIDEVIKNRDKLRELIMNSVRDKLASWGIWIETIEITDVKILSTRV